MLSASEKLHNEALTTGQVAAMLGAHHFLNGNQHWNMEDAIEFAASQAGYDADLAYLTSMVLFPVAVVFLKTGKHV